jgi:methanogenic corrinoid protein MtbC1
VTDDLPFRLPPVDPATVDDVPSTVLSAELLAGLLADGDDELAAWALRHALMEAPRAVVYDGLLAEAMQLVGERWVSGQWSIAEEHLASRTLLRALEQVRPPMGPESRVGPLAVLAGVTGEQHMIGLVCLEQVLAEAGWTVANLGADLPPTDLGGFVARNEVSLVALTASHEDRLGDLAEAVMAVRVAAANHGLPILVGGRFAAVPGLAASVGADGAALSLAAALAFATAHQPA